MKKRSIVIATLVALITIVVIVFALIQNQNNQGLHKVVIHIIPTDATVLINNGRYSSGDTVRLPDGVHKYNAFRSGFEQINDSIKVSESSQKQLIISLKPNSKEGEDWLKDNPGAVGMLERIAGRSAVEEGERKRSSNPIIKDLPITNLLFKIGYKQDPSGEGIIITIHAPEQYRQDAIRKLVSLGYDISEYKVEFVNLKDPFDEK